MWWLVQIASAAPVDCDAPVEKVVVDRLLDQAEVAIGELDSEVLADAIMRTHLLVRCIETRFTPPDVAKLYRLTGISHYVADDLLLAANAFKVARAIEPQMPINEALGLPLRMTYDATPPASGTVAPLARPADGSLAVDGLERDEAPVDRGYFLQWLDREGVVRGTWMVPEGGTAGYPLRGEEVPGVVTRPNSGGGPNNGLLISGVASVAAGAAAMGGAALLEGRFNKSTLPSDELGGLVGTNRALGYGGIGLAVVGTGLFGVSFVVGR